MSENQTRRNIYEVEVDFAALALQSPSFNKFLKSNGQLDFSDPKAVQQLTKSLLQRDFGIEIELPEDRLCPPVPNRLNYVLWIQDLLDTTSDKYSDQYDADREVIGIDIGTGASCIYPLLGCCQRPRWKFAATDIDEKNMAYAKRNILHNNLQSRIRPLLTRSDGPLIPLDSLGLNQIDFTICNPPFYASTKDLLFSAASKSRPPHSACTGADVEMVTPGGEVAFVSRMIQESKALRNRCQWFTSMLGMYSSIEAIVEILKAERVVNWAVKDLVQGQKTRRWCVGWSWGEMRPDQRTARGTATLPKHLLPFPSEYCFTVSSDYKACAEQLQTIISRLEIKWQYRPAIATGVGFAKGNVWSRAARRKQKEAEELPDAEGEDEDPALGFKIRMKGRVNATDVIVRWLRGKDSVLFESFCGMLKRQLSE